MGPDFNVLLNFVSCTQIDRTASESFLGMLTVGLFEISESIVAWTLAIIEESLSMTIVFT